MTEFDKGQIYYFTCDKQGKKVGCCGYKNSSGTVERPFVIVSHKTFNNREKNEDIYAIPISSRSRSSNNFDVEITPDSFQGPWKKTKIHGNILCDKLCRLRQKEIYSKNKDMNGILTNQTFDQIKTKTRQFITKMLEGSV